VAADNGEVWAEPTVLAAEAWAAIRAGGRKTDTFEMEYGAWRAGQAIGKGSEPAWPEQW